MSVTESKTTGRLTVKEQAAIDRLLHEHCKPVSNDSCRYAEGWSDAEVAKQVGVPGKVTSVSYRRIALYGKFAKRERPADPALAPIIEAVNMILRNMGESKRLLVNEAGVLVFENPATDH